MARVSTECPSKAIGSRFANVNRTVARMTRLAGCGALVVCSFFAMAGNSSSVCVAQSPVFQATSEGIIGNGSVDVTVAPSRLRLQVLVKAEDRDAEGALKLLRKHQARVEPELKALGADPASIVFSYPSITVGIPGVDNPDAARKTIKQQAAQMRNMNPQMRGQFPVQAVEDDDQELPSVFTAACTLTAEWPLPKGLDDNAIMLPSTLKSKIDEKDFRGKKLCAELDPTELELIQPLLGANVYYAAQNASPDVQLSYVAVLSEQEEQEALKSAFAKAKSQAERLAGATGRKLVRLESVSSTVQAVATNTNYPYVMATTSASSMAPPKRIPREVSAEDPNQLARTVTITVTFSCE